jgi:aldose 1-epimerase
VTLILEGHGWMLELCPDTGGSIGALRKGGRDVLRPAPPSVRDPLQTGCFPLLPFANRIDGGRFSLDGRDVALPALPGFSPHALHGEAWLMPWQVESRSADTACLVCRHEAGAWPWIWSARQRFSLSGSGLRIELALTNESGTSMPAGLGFHPYFPAGPDARIHFIARSVWLTDAREIPVRAAEPEALVDWSEAPAVGPVRGLVDHCYDGWTGEARIEDADGVVQIAASPVCAGLHVFTPSGQDYVCLEPVTHRPDAVNGAPGDMPVLGPGETAEIWMTVTAGRM